MEEDKISEINQNLYDLLMFVKCAKNTYWFKTFSSINDTGKPIHSHAKE
jgi:hypothetical protein